MKLPSIIKLSWVAAAAVASGVASASPYCTDAPRSEWQDPIAFQQKLRDQGMRVDDFEITRGGCYKVAGWDKEKRRIKQYYNAKTAELVRSRMDRDWDDSDDYRGYDHDWGGMGRRHDGMMRRRDDR
jgi:hypothetical protein